MIKKREVYYFKIAEAWANTKFDIGDGYGILKVYAEDIREVIAMTSITILMKMEKEKIQMTSVFVN